LGGRWISIVFQANALYEWPFFFRDVRGKLFELSAAQIHGREIVFFCASLKLSISMADLEISCNLPLSYVNKSFTQHPVLFLKHIVKAYKTAVGVKIKLLQYCFEFQN
jgi:hypothetical protein